MTKPTNHHLTITTQYGKQIRGEVVYIQPTAPRSAEVHILTIDWLDAYRFKAVYTTPTQSGSGFYSVHGYASADDQWLFRGTFERAQDDSAQTP
jgi:hypothetical protein